MKKTKFLVLVGLIGVMGTFWSCDKNGDIVLFSIENDKQLGEQVAAEIEADESFVILSPEQYPEAYSYLQAMTDDILSSDKVTYKDEFAWKIHIIDDDVLNAEN